VLEYFYDRLGRVVWRTDYDGSRTDYQYDGSGRLVATTNLSYVAGVYQQDAAGRLLQRGLSNGAKTRYAYDANGWLASLSNETDRGTVVNASTYTRDRTGRVLTDTTAAGTTTYSYDALYRLIAADYPGAANDESFSYDRVGNRQTHTKAGITHHHRHDANNRLTEVREGSASGPIRIALLYDANGNLRLRCEGGTVTRSSTTCTGTRITSYQWDARDRLIQVNLPSGSQERYAYDLDGLRIGVTDTRNQLHQHLREGEHLEGVYDASGNIEARYLRGALIDEVINGYVYQGTDWTHLTFHHDGLTSVVGLSSHDGRVLEQTRYSAFGERQSNVLDTVGGLFPTNQLRYTGREEETATGLYYYRARYYDPGLGRFLSEDPLGFEAGINFYAYVSNDPVNANDPTGEIAISKAVSEWFTAKFGNDLLAKGIEMHHSIPREILNKLPPEVANHPAIRGAAGAPNRWPVPTPKHRAIHAEGYNAAWTEALTKLGDSPSVSEVVAIRDRLAAEFNIAQYQPYSPGGALLGAVGTALVTATSLAEAALNPVSTFLIGTKVADGTLTMADRMAGAAAVNPFKPINGWSVGPWAGGGFVLYPGKVNANQQRAVYSK